MKQYHFYDPVTGLFTDRTFATDIDESTSEHARHLVANTPKGLAIAAGTFDHLSQKVDVAKVAAAGELVLDAHQAAVEVMRKNFVADRTCETFREPPPPAFFATAAHVVDWQPPQPTADHEWHEPTKRWQLSQAAQAKAVDVAAVAARIAELAAASVPLMRKAILGDEAARTALQGIEEEIARLPGYTTP